MLCLNISNFSSLVFRISLSKDVNVHSASGLEEITGATVATAAHPPPFPEVVAHQSRDG